ncbi:MAG: DUF4190 domain-containing protein [Lachnospiraceae bacterium]|jgi:hypothetical protein
MNDYDQRNYNQQNYDQNSDYYQNYHPDNRSSKDKMAVASLIFGIIGFLGMSFLLPGVICGIIAAVLAGASRYNSGRWYGSSIAGMVLGIIAVIGTFVMLHMTLQVLSDPDLMNQLNQMMQMYYGQTI